MWYGVLLMGFGHVVGKKQGLVSTTAAILKIKFIFGGKFYR